MIEYWVPILLFAVALNLGVMAGLIVGQYKRVRLARRLRQLAIRHKRERIVAVIAAKREGVEVGRKLAIAALNEKLSTEQPNKTN